MESVSCICGSPKAKKLFQKPSRGNNLFNLMRCRECGLEYLSPRPDTNEINEYYNLDYFKRRTDRGYDDYFSDEIKKEIGRVVELNLKDLNFYRFEQGLTGKKRALDIGCAAGYFVEYLNKRGWDSCGIDIAQDCVNAAEKSGLNVSKGNYLDADFRSKFDLVTLWATIEHLHYPYEFLKKISLELKDKGMIYISTCRSGGINFMKLFGKNWRFYNFPEHLYFFSFPAIKKVLNNAGFNVVEYITYGSGIGKQGSAVRKYADFLARHIYLGDMMLISAVKV